MHIHLIIEGMCIATIVMTRPNYNNVYTGANRGSAHSARPAHYSRSARKAAKRSWKISVKELALNLVKRVISTVITIWSVVIGFGGIAILYTVEGVAVTQRYLLIARKLTLETFLGLGIVIAIYAALFIVYCLCYVMQRKANRISHKMLPEYRGTWKRYEKFFAFIARGIVAIFKGTWLVLRFLWDSFQVWEK